MSGGAFERAAELLEALRGLDDAARAVRLSDEPDDVRELVEAMIEGDREPLASALSQGLPGLRGLVGQALGGEQGGEGPGDGEEIAFDLASGPFRVDGVLARGGMGIVYRGHDASIGRTVAIKVLVAGARDRHDARLRFVEEAQVAGQLEHPGIVPIYHLGRDDRGRPFFVMKLVEGRTLAELLSARASPQEDLTRYLGHVLRICQTVAYAHARGVIHRDLKPANVMVGAFGEVQVLDWGLAKVLAATRSGPEGGGDDRPAGDTDTGPPPRTARSDDGSSDAVSLDGTVMGTPGYMPPEQAVGDVAHLDRRSDVFSLGAILCEVLTGVPPFVGDRRAAWRATRDGVLAPAYERLAGSGADPTLIELARRCLARDPEERPGDAGRVAAAIEGSLGAAEERAQAAALEAARARARAASERRARRLSLGLAGVSGLLIATVVIVWLWQEFARERAIDGRSAELSAAIEVARERFERARSAPVEELGPWRSAAVAIDAAARQALPGPDGVEARDEVRVSFGTLQSAFAGARIEAEEAAARAAADRAVLARLEEIRAPTGDGADPFDYPRMQRAYEQLFAQLGLAIDDQESTALAFDGHRLGAALGRALDQWAILHYLHSVDERAERLSFRSRLLELASRADPHPRRDAIRRAARDDDHDALRAFADDDTLDEAESVILLAGLLRTIGRDELAVDLLRAAARRQPSDFWLSLHAGIALRAIALRASSAAARRAGFVEAVGYLRGAIAARPDSLEPRHLLGATFEGLEQWSDVRAEFALLAERAPGDGHARAHLANAIASLEGWPAALDQARSAAESAPNDAYALGTYAYGLVHTDREWSAVRPLRRAWELDPTLNAAYRYAQILERTGDVEGSVAMWHEVIERAAGAGQHEVVSLYNAASAYLHAGLLARAEAAYRRCIELAPDYPEARCNLGSVLLGLGRFEEGHACYRAGDELGRRSGRAWNHPSDQWVARAARAVEFERALGAYGDGPLRAAAVELEPTVERAEFALRLGQHRLASDWYEVMMTRPPALPRQAIDLAALASARCAADGLGSADDALDDARRALGWLDTLRTLLMADVRARPDIECRPVRTWIGIWRVRPELAWLRAVDQLPEPLRAEARAFWERVDRDLQEIVSTMDRLAKAH